MKDAAQKRMPVESLDTSLPTKGKGDLTTLNMRPDKSAMPYNRNAQLGDCCIYCIHSKTVVILVSCAKIRYYFV